MTDQSDTPLAAYFAKDPMSLSEQDLDTIITKLRSQRKRFVLGDKSAGSTKPSKVSVAQEAAKKITGEIKLGDLGL